MKKKVKKIKKLSLSTEKKKAWGAFSKYIRTRDCIKTTGTPYAGKCVTCNRRYIFQVLEAGHFLPGRHNSILFDERAVNAQCYGCNVGKKGNFMAYYHAMEKMYGLDVIAELEEQERQSVQYKALDYKELAEYYKQKTEELLKQ